MFCLINVKKPGAPAALLFMAKARAKRHSCCKSYCFKDLFCLRCGQVLCHSNIMHAKYYSYIFIFVYL